MPPLSTRVNDESSVVTKSSIFFSFNCSWFSDVNGAVRFFTVVVTESKGKQSLVENDDVAIVYPLLVQPPVEGRLKVKDGWRL